MRRLGVLWIAVGIAGIGGVGSGCATTLSSHQTARPVEPGHVEFNVATGFYAPVGAAVYAVAQGVEAATDITQDAASGEDVEVSPELQQRLLTAGIALAVMPPSPVQEITLRTGILQNWDVGLRYSVNALRLDTKYRVYQWDQGPEVPEEFRQRADISLGLAGSRYLFSNLLFDALDFVQMNDFSRWDLEVPVYLSYEWGYIWRVYASPKYHYSRTSFDATLVNTSAQAGNISGLDLSLPSEVSVHFFGATVGAMVGYRYVWVALELTGGYTHCRPFVFGQRRDLGGATFYPSIGVVVRI